MIFPNGFNDELSRSPFKEFLACQRPEVFSTFNSFIQDENPSLILEIGTCFGGLSLSLSESSSLINCKFITYDILENLTSIQLRNYGVDFRIENIFIETSRQCYDFKESFLKEFNSIKGKKIILCDGGNKIGEFNAFAKILDVGDILMAHDFAYSEEFFSSNSFWGWNEIMEKDIAESMKQFNLSYYKMNTWSKLAWCSVKKIF